MELPSISSVKENKEARIQVTTIKQKLKDVGFKQFLQKWGCSCFSTTLSW